MKKLLKDIVARILGWQVRRLRNKNDIKVVTVVGSFGKTSTKLAITQLLEQGFKVRSQEGNYNDLVSVPLVFFGLEMPSLFNPFSWLRVFIKNERAIKNKYPYEVVILEIGPDGPGQMYKFGWYLKIDMGVLTSIAPEHMEYFDSLDAVAKEELEFVKFTDKIFVNSDLVPEEYLKTLNSERTTTYGIKQPAQIRMTNIKFDDHSASFKISKNSNLLLEGEHEQITEPQLYSITAATAVAHELGMTERAIQKGIKNIKPVSGRMQHLKGIKDSLILDDTYNASPEAMRAALDTLYRVKAPQKIAILGNMNELGGYSRIEHKKIGEYCDSRELNLVVTIGPDANKYLAPEAEEKGCKVKTFDSPYEAGQYVKEQIEPKAVILAKGSQNKVFAEEAIKEFLNDPKDASKLVRQSAYWLKRKKQLLKGV